MTPDELEGYDRYFNPAGFWRKVKSVARKAGAKVLYYALILYYALQSPQITPRDRALIIGALGYFILPLDLIPDFIPGMGFGDDLFALGIAIAKVARCITPDIKDQARNKLEEWLGPVNPKEIIIDIDGNRKD